MDLLRRITSWFRDIVWSQRREGPEDRPYETRRTLAGIRSGLQEVHSRQIKEIPDKSARTTFLDDIRKRYRPDRADPIPGPRQPFAATAAFTLIDPPKETQRYTYDRDAKTFVFLSEEADRSGDTRDLEARPESTYAVEFRGIRRPDASQNASLRTGLVLEGDRAFLEIPRSPLHLRPSNQTLSRLLLRRESMRLRVSSRHEPSEDLADPIISLTADGETGHE